MKRKNWEFPTAYTVLFLILILVTVLTHIIPSGKYDRLSYQENTKEFLEVFNEVLLRTEKDNFSLFSLRNKKEKLDVVHYTSEELKDTLETGWDPR